MGLPAKVILVPLAVLFAGVVIGALITNALNPRLHDVASAARMPIPGSKDVTLEARRYGLYFGLSNAPSRKMMHIPKLKITLVPPAGKADPEFVDLDGYGDDTLVDGFTTARVAYINVTAPGSYHVQVESPEEAGGSFSIGEPPQGDRERGNLYGGSVALAGLIAAAVLLIRGLRLRRIATTA